MKRCELLIEKFSELEEVKKSSSAKKVLQLMDSEEDGQDRYMEFVKRVAKEDNISISQLEKELEPFI